MFELRLPGTAESSFTGAKAVVEIPDRPIQRLQILVRDANAKNLHPGRYKIFVNGKGLGNVLEERTVPEGTLLVMEPETLRKRPDELFDARENAIEIIAFNRAGRQYYQNWVVRTNADQQNTLFAYSSSLSSDDPAGSPPDILISQPAQPVTVPPRQASVSVPIRGMLSRGARLTVQGKPVDAGTNSAMNPFQTSVTVPVGQREIVLQAVDGKGNTRKVLIPVYATAVAKPLRFAGQKYALVIGISEFGKSPGAPPRLSLAAAEAEEFAAKLESAAGFKKANIRLLTDDKADVEQVRVGLTDFVSKAQANDLLVVYVATHGLHDPRPSRADRLFFAVYGTQLAQLDSTALGLSDLQRLLDRSVRTNQCVLIFDVGHRLDKEWLFAGGRSVVNSHLLNLFGSKAGWQVLVSGSSNQVSVEQVEGKAGGLFQYWLSKALAGAADLNSDQVVTPKELFRFVSEKVKADSGGTQTPRFTLSEQTMDQPIQ